MINFLSKIWKLFFYIYIKIFSYKTNNIKILDGAGDKRLDAFFKNYNKNIGDNIISVKRNWKYYKWRYFQNPYNNSKIAVLVKNKKIIGLIAVTKNIENNINKIEIKDLIAQNNEDYKYLLAWALKFSLKEKATTLNIWSDKFSIKNNKKNIFYRNGFIRHGIQANKTIIMSVLNNKLKNKKLYFELRKYLERI